MEEKYFGCLLGLAVGDALGTTLECTKAGKDFSVSDIVGGGKFDLYPGQWTDDTSMALCIAESLTKKLKFDPQDQIRRYLRWYEEGHLSSTGECFDIGITCRMAMFEFRKKNVDYPASASDKARQGNGCIMRLAAIPLAYRTVPYPLFDQISANSSRTTHGAVQCQQTTVFYSRLIRLALEGKSKDEILSPTAIEKSVLDNFCDETKALALGSYKTKEPPEIYGAGYVIAAAEAALWAFYKTATFKEGALLVANLCGDADTTAAIYGQLAGAHYGSKGIPQGWQDKCALVPLIHVLTTELYRLSSGPISDTGEFKTEVSVDDRFVHVTQMMDILEGLWKPIMRKLVPGPKMYRQISEFESDRVNFKTDFKAKLAVDKWDADAERLWRDFDNRFSQVAVKVSGWCGRANPASKTATPSAMPTRVNFLSAIQKKST
eukprot:TRINITY_DN8647_c0_g1_i1.p1 TRINITY_DN8647_c0_g1~~TRINITY_DN8647_c0_g1_i1.p1  ORF type:complete len:434 (-),score=90.36 TRINITY_DN8647_c0_g1_i1:230-1531(-)